MKQFVCFTIFAADFLEQTEFKRDEIQKVLNFCYKSGIKVLTRTLYVDNERCLYQILFKNPIYKHNRLDEYNLFAGTYYLDELKDNRRIQKEMIQILKDEFEF